MKRLVTGFVLTCTAAFATNGLLQAGYGVNSKAMGGVGIAYPQDSLASALNPAGLALLCDRFDVGFHWVEHRSRHTEGPANEDDSFQPTFVSQMNKSRKDLWWPEGGINWRVRPNHALGVATYMVGQWKVKTFTNGKTPRGMEYAALAITPAWAWSITPCHQIGVAVNVVVGRISVTNNPLNPEASVVYPRDDGKWITNEGFDYEWGVNARFGWIGRFGKCLRLGITYQTPTSMSLYRKYRGFIPAGGDANLPGQLGIGLAAGPIYGVVAAIDVVHVFWRHGKLFRNANTLDSGEYGANDGPGFGWNEQTIFKFGLSWDIFSCLTLRLGYNYGNTPIPPGNPLNAFNMATIEDHITTGGTFRWGCNEISVCYLYGFRHSVEGPASGMGGNLEPVDPTTVLYDRARSHSVGIAYGRRF